jgi:predicted 3-demethylubiquinone-9 3-methyltransferase (glyoxalase superfamily)
MATKKRKATRKTPARKPPIRKLSFQTPQRKSSSRAPQLRQRSGIQSLTPCLTFQGQAEEAARFYVSVFRKSKMGPILRYPAAGREIHGQPEGTVLTAEFTLDGIDFVALNGPPFKFSEAISFQVFCRDQEEVDHYWEKLGTGGDPKAQQCGWLKDKFGVSWQIVPEVMMKMLKTKGPAMERAFMAMMPMKKLDIATLERAFKGK